MFGTILAGMISGLALGMMGAGGTIIGLPMLLYLGGPQGHAAFGTNAFGVAIIAALLVFWRLQMDEINIILGMIFAVPGLFGIAVGAQLGLVYPANKLIFLLSFLIVIVAVWIGYLSTRTTSVVTGDTKRPCSKVAYTNVFAKRDRIIRIVPTAFTVGAISGFFAIGGGFLVVPGLALAASIDLRESARCSLVPITAFAGLDAIEYILAGNVHYATSGLMVSAGIIGAAAGLIVGNRLSLRLTQRLFAVFLGLIAAYMIIHNA